MFHSNHMLISHHQDIGDFHNRDLEMTHKGQSRSKVKIHFYLLGNGEHFVPGHPGPGSNHLDGTGHFHFQDHENDPVNAI